MERKCQDMKTIIIFLDIGTAERISSDEELPNDVPDDAAERIDEALGSVRVDFAQSKHSVCHCSCHISDGGKCISQFSAEEIEQIRLIFD